MTIQHVVHQGGIGTTRQGVVEDGADHVLNADQSVQTGIDGVLRGGQTEVERHTGHPGCGPVGTGNQGGTVGREVADGVVACTALHKIVAQATHQGVVARTAVQGVIARSAVEHVGRVVACEGVVKTTAHHVFKAGQQVPARIDGVLRFQNRQVHRHAGHVGRGWAQHIHGRGRCACGAEVGDGVDAIAAQQNVHAWACGGGVPHVAAPKTAHVGVTDAVRVEGPAFIGISAIGLAQPLPSAVTAFNRVIAQSPVDHDGGGAEQGKGHGSEIDLDAQFIVQGAQLQGQIGTTTDLVIEARANDFFDAEEQVWRRWRGHRGQGGRDRVEVNVNAQAVRPCASASPCTGRVIDHVVVHAAVHGVEETNVRGVHDKAVVAKAARHEVIAQTAIQNVVALAAVHDVGTATTK